jgi:hypothetical protein
MQQRDREPARSPDVAGGIDRPVLGLVPAVSGLHVVHGTTRVPVHPELRHDVPRAVVRGGEAMVNATV